MLTINTQFVAKVILFAVVFVIAPSGAVFMSTAPNGVEQVTGVALETVRDVKRAPHTPVEYTYQGVQRTGLAATSGIAGEPVTFWVTVDGAPANGDTRLSQFAFTFLVTAVGLMAFIWSFVWAYETRDEKLRRLRFLDRSRRHYKRHLNPYGMSSTR